MARQTTAIVTDDSVEATTKAPVQFNTLTPGTLAGVDVQNLEGDALMAYAQAAKDRLEDLTGSFYVDKRTGVVYSGTRQIGNVLRPIKAPGVIPAALKLKDEHIVDGKPTLPKADQLKGLSALDMLAVAIPRYMMARIRGNGVNLLNQHSKDDDGAALAMGTAKSGLL